MLKLSRSFPQAKKSFDDAVSTGIAKASGSVTGIQGAWIQDQKVVVSNGKITEYRVSMMVTFVVAETKAKAKAPVKKK